MKSDTKKIANSTPLHLIKKGEEGLNIYLKRTQTESILKQQPIERTNLDVVFVADNENNGLKQHHINFAKSYT